LKPALLQCASKSSSGRFFAPLIRSITPTQSPAEAADWFFGAFVMMVCPAMPEKIATRTITEAMIAAWRTALPLPKRDLGPMRDRKRYDRGRDAPIGSNPRSAGPPHLGVGGNSLCRALAMATTRRSDERLAHHSSVNTIAWPRSHWVRIALPTAAPRLNSSASALERQSAAST